MTQETPAAYFASLTIENVKCFKEKQTIDLSDGNDKPAMWTVILGNNNTGKTTLLRCLADLEATVLKERHYIPKIMTRSNRSFLYNISSPITLKSNIFFEKEDCFLKNDWSVNANVSSYSSNSWSSSSTFTLDHLIDRLVIYGYGTNRRAGKTSLSETENQDNTVSLFSDKVALLNTEEWLLQVDYASKNGIESAKFRLDKIKKVLTSGILPDVENFKCVSQEINNKINNFVECETDYGWVRLHDLGYGYQSMTAWIVDLAQKMFGRYPESDNPLHEPAIVLIDEIDLHLHPEWQRNIIKYLSELFPKTQFIVTAHSPLIVQSAENINLVILEKQGDHVVINQPDLTTYEGWTVEEILMNLMGLDKRVSSDKYLEIIRNFETALDTENYQEAKKSYGELITILHPNNVQRELLELQMSSLVPN
jgi:predicted ATP-binding protein involved in virulence